MTCRTKQKAISNKLLCLPYTDFFTRNEHLTQKWTTQSFLKELLTRTRHRNSWTPNTTNRWQLYLKSQPACVRSLETGIENLKIYWLFAITDCLHQCLFHLNFAWFLYLWCLTMFGIFVLDRWLFNRRLWPNSIKTLLIAFNW